MDAAIIGVGQTPYQRRHTVRTDELVRAACNAALQDAGLSIDDVDTVVVGYAPDGLSGENLPDRAFLGGAGGNSKPYFRVNTGGSTGMDAAHAALDYVDAGMSRVVMVAAVERMGQAMDVPGVFGSIFDPVLERGAALSTMTMGGLRAARLIMQYGYTPEHWARLARRNLANATRNPYAQVSGHFSVDEILDSPILTWPIRRLDACPVSEGACAVVIAGGDEAKEFDSPAWIAGRGHCTDTYFMGDRMGRAEGDIVDLLGLEHATRRAYSEAGITDARSDVDVFEIHAPWSNMETMAYGALRICDPPEGPELVAADFGAWGSETVINPSGGAQTANPVSATALIRLAECALQVRGRAGASQVPDCRVAVATGGGGTGQFGTCTVVRSN